MDDEYHDPTLQPYYTAIGRLCHAWADLERHTTSAFTFFAGMPNAEPSMATASCLNFRHKLDAIKIAAVSRFERTDPKYVTLVLETVSYIDNQLRNRRNRLVHDGWLPNWGPGWGDSVRRVCMTPTIAKAQARQPRKVAATSATKESVADIELMTSDIAAHAHFLIVLTSHKEHPGIDTHEELLELRPPRPLLPPRSEKQCPSDSDPQAH